MVEDTNRKAKLIVTEFIATAVITRRTAAEPNCSGKPSTAVISREFAQGKPTVQTDEAATIAILQSIATEITDTKVMWIRDSINTTSSKVLSAVIKTDITTVTNMEPAATGLSIS
jgi:hypothetical protein